MISGLYCDRGHFHDFDDPYDFYAGRAEVLKGRSLVCGCAPNRQLRLSIVDGYRMVTHVRCVDGSHAHEPWCVFRRESQPRPCEYSAQLFFPGSDEVYDYGFNTWARAIVSTAYSACFARGMEAVGTRDFLHCLGYHVAQWARHAPGMVLEFGIAEEFVAPHPTLSSTDGLWPFGLWAFRSRELEHRQAHATLHAMRRALQTISIFGHTIAGPYCFVGVRPRDATAYFRFAVVPIAQSAKTLCPVDSDHERAHLTPLLEAGSRVLKPLTRSQLNSMPASCRSMLGGPLEFRFRPDWIVYRGSEVHVTELAGFDQPDYLREFARKARYWRDLEREGHIYFHALA